MNIPTVGTLCTGVDMTGLALNHLYGPLNLLWHAEVDPHASKVLAHHQPDVPNLGDITCGAPGGCAPEVTRRCAYSQWVEAPRVDILVSTHPCQGNSHAGKRLGAADTRNLWPAVAGAVEAQTPSIFLMENVPGLFNIDGGDLFGQHLADLDALGYHVKWTTVGSCKIGAPHCRHRLFLTATRAHGPAPLAPPIGERAGGRWVSPIVDLFGDRAAPPVWPMAGEVVGGYAWRHAAVPCGSPPFPLLPTPTARDWKTGTANMTDGAGRPLNEVAANLLTHGWGVYEPAVREWERRLGRPSPAPTEANKMGGPRHSTLLPEWMLGLPAGYVTDHVGRNAALRIIGNGVQWQAATYAFRLLLPVLPVSAVEPVAAYRHGIDNGGSSGVPS